MSELAKTDPEIAAVVRKEEERQQRKLVLIASENYASRAVMEAQGSVLTNKYAEGYPGRRYYGSCEWVDEAERTAIARAIVGQPRILLADEPTGNLDSQMGDEIVNILLELNRSEGTTVVMVTHEPRQAEKSARIVRFFDGRRVN